ncbi:MAG: hypothetical protein LUQ65_12595 [Candidatus Helarchaeota archaeon]|nr:hypothetical protein [Candidatus Helarchaeota archaeon]
MIEIEPDAKVKDSSEEEFYFEMPYLALVDTDVWKGKNPWSYDVGKLLQEFYEKMKHNLKFKILGLALQTAAQIHYAKILQLIQSEEKFKEHLDIEKKRHETAALGRLGLPLRRLGEEADSEELFDDLVDVLLDEKRRLERKKKQEEKQKEGVHRTRRVPLTEAIDMDNFYEVDADRMNIQEKNDLVLQTIKRLCSQAPNGEILFVNLLKELGGLAADPRIQTARVLLSLLFLIADKSAGIEADQDIDSKQIYIRAHS